MNNIVLPKSVLAQTPHEKTSSKYTFIPTTRIIDVMQGEGWNVVKAKTQNSKAYPEHCKHIVEFEKPELSGTFGDLTDGTRLRILVRNSHNASSSFEFLLGLFRLVCANGLVVSKGTAESFRVRHVGYTDDKVAQSVSNVLLKAPVVAQTIKTLQDTRLTTAAIGDMATNALNIAGLELNQYNTTQIITAKRVQDANPNAWNVYNIVQERILKGMQSQYTDKQGRQAIRKTRAINSLDRQVSVNQELWDLAVSYI